MTDPHPSPVSTDPPTLGELVERMSAQTSELIRSELRLAQVELATKSKRLGIGAGLFGGGGLFAILGLGALVAAAILALAGPLPGWLAAIIVGVALFVVAAVAALVGKREISEGTPPMPTEAVEGLKQDVQTLKPGSSA